MQPNFTNVKLYFVLDQLMYIKGIMGEQAGPHAVVLAVRLAAGLAAARLHREGGRRPAPGDAGGAAAAAAARRVGARARAAPPAPL